MAPLHVRAARGRRMFNPSQHQTQWKRVKKVRSYFSPEHTITGVFRAGVQDVGDVTRGTCLRAHTGVDRKEKERRTRGVKRYIQDMDVSSPHTRPLVVENATRKITGFSTSGATCCQVGKLRLGGEITKTCREQRQTEWHWWGRNDTGMRRLQASQSSWPRVIWATTSGAKCIPLRTVVSAQCILSSAGASEQCLKPKGLTQILQNVQKRKSKHAGFNDEMSTVTHDCVTNTGSE